MDDTNKFEVAHALARLISYAPSTQQERAQQVMAVLLATPPLLGWCPLNSDNALLLALWLDEEA